MLYNKRHEVFLGIIYLLWLITLLFAIPSGYVLLLGSLMVLYLLGRKLSGIRTVILGLLIVFVAELGVVISFDEIYDGEIANPNWGIFLVLVAVVGYYGLTLWRNEANSSLPEIDKPNDANERQQLVALINSMADGVIATDQNQKATIYNGAALDILNANVTLEGQDVNKVLHIFDSSNKRVDIFAKAHKARTSYASRDLIIKDSDGEKINIYLSVSPVRVGYGQEAKLGYIILMRDITKEKSLEEERDEFISVVSHELRTPVTVAEGAVSNAQYVAHKENASELVSKSLSEAHDSAVFLADMINDLSMLSRAERGVLQVEPESIDIVTLLESLAVDYKIQVKQKGLKLVVSKGRNIQPVNSAPLYVKEILQNFITNSIKYTEKGSITLSAKHTPHGVDVYVKDTGIGISKHDQKKLFQKFFRSEDYRTRKNSGTGLGLYVTMKLAKLINAEITVKSKLNVGSEFKIYIPNLEAHHHRKRNNN